MVQRIIAQEKQIKQLQSELDRFKAANNNEVREVDDKAKKERDRVKWNTMMDEIAKLKIKVCLFTDWFLEFSLMPFVHRTAKRTRSSSVSRRISRTSNEPSKLFIRGFSSAWKKGNRTRLRSRRSIRLLLRTEL